MSADEADSIAHELARYDQVLNADTTSNQGGGQKKILLREIDLINVTPRLGGVLRECYKFITESESVRQNCSDCTTQVPSTARLDPEMSLNEVMRILGKKPAKPCSCGPWGTCTKNNCSCDNLCPADFRIFSKKTSVIENMENQLSFTLGDSVFLAAGVPKTEGYCWGHSVVTQRFFRQATYAPDERAPYDREKQQPQWVEYYRQIIQDIVGRNIPRTVPGFKNLYELSEDPLLKPLIARFVANQWGKEAASFDGVKSVFLNLGKSDENDMLRFIDEVEARINMGIDPVIVSTPKEASASVLGIDLIHSGAHVAVGTRVARQGYNVMICMMDSNRLPMDNQNCKNYLVINAKKGTIQSCEIEGFSAPKCEPVLGLAIPDSEDRSVCLQFVRQWRSCNQKYDCHKTK